MMSSASNKRPRRSEEEQCRLCFAKRKKHLYLALYELNEDGLLVLNIRKLDADNMEDDAALPEPAVQFAAPERAPMALTAVGTSIFITTSPHLRLRGDERQGEMPAPPLPTLVYDTETGALTIGPLLPDGYLDGDSGGVPTAVGGERLYALTKVYDAELRRFSVSLRVLSRTPTSSSWIHSETIMAWSWNNDDGPPPPPPPPSLERDVIKLTSYAVHPDGRTIFMSTPDFTWSFDTGGNGAWKELGFWSLPFTGQAYFDGDLDAWVGLHRKDKGYVCCCRVPSRSATAVKPPVCTMLKERMFFPSDDSSIRRRQKATLTYMGDSRFCLVENVANSRDSPDGTLHVTLFGLRYDRNGELCTRVRRTTRSYAVSFNNGLFPHAAFWM